MAESNARINQVVEQIKREFGKGIVDLLKATNKKNLNGKGKVTSQPTIDRNSLRWTLAWKQDKISYRSQHRRERGR